MERRPKKEKMLGSGCDGMMKKRRRGGEEARRRGGEEGSLYTLLNTSPKRWLKQRNFSSPSGHRRRRRRRPQVSVPVRMAPGVRRPGLRTRHQQHLDQSRKLLRGPGRRRLSTTVSRLSVRLSAQRGPAEASLCLLSSPLLHLSLGSTPPPHTLLLLLLLLPDGPLIDLPG
ncbi:hypothetical protein EYF80_050162 [Liparis tanakae]|uniref:Uncharacterized protein n=1 Tax=Liparis tanakae TaxID=230148 RepID=A0A4Z2FER9_9TELE|nr:hypothetical protein EYF80_050162 [Liparis tanakae]